jgi:hypothetical protein
MAPKPGKPAARGKGKEEEVKEPTRERPRPEGGKMAALRKLIANLDKDNFEKLYEFEDFLVNDVGLHFYAKTMKKIRHAAIHVGVEIKEGFAAGNKASSLRKAKQDAFVKGRVEAIEAEEAAAAKEAAEAEATKAATAEDEPLAAVKEETPADAAS